jgi:hypothetical protein
VENKITGLNEMFLAGNTSLSEDALKGVTYDSSGLGGCYGGMPRLGSSVLQCLLPGYNSDHEHDSEVTDYSRTEQPEAGAGDGQDATSRYGTGAKDASAVHPDASPHSTSLMEVG